MKYMNVCRSVKLSNKTVKRKSVRNAYLLVTVSSRINSFQALGADVEELGPTEVLLLSLVGNAQKIAGLQII
jgi:hypothetical protein